MASRREIIDRIEKLYALASGGTSPGESAAATAMAEKLAKKHSINDSEINKHTYTKGTKSKQRTSYDDAADHWRKASGPSWEDYTRWQKTHEQRRRKDYDNFSRDYYQRTFDPEFVCADKIRETDKAVLLNVHLDASKYPWTHQRSIVVSAWIPKSQIVTQVGNLWLLNKVLLVKNLRNNIPWLIAHHPVFKGQHIVNFHFKDIL